MAEKVYDMGADLALFKGRPEELIAQDVNARVMTPEAFARLTDNIRKDKRLEQLPFAVVRDSGKHELISGHHRRDAAQGAGLAEIFWLGDTRTDMTRGTVVAKQLAHNSLQGKDDPATLKDLYAEMDSVHDILESFLTPADFDDVSQLEPADAVDLGLDIELKCIALVFTPAVLASLDRIEQWFESNVPDNADVVGVLPLDMLARVRQVALNVAKIEDVRSLGSVFARMCEIVETHLAEVAQKALPDAATPAKVSA